MEDRIHETMEGEEDRGWRMRVRSDSEQVMSEEEIHLCQLSIKILKYFNNLS